MLFNPERHQALDARPWDEEVARGSIVRIAAGTEAGFLPGSGSFLGSFAAYSLEKKISIDPSRFG